MDVFEVTWEAMVKVQKNNFNKSRKAMKSCNKTFKSLPNLNNDPAASQADVAELAIYARKKNY